MNGAHLTSAGVEFRVWAPDAKAIEVIIEDHPAADIPLRLDSAGLFTGTARLDAGTRYRYRVDGRGPFPDPCSRFQPAGPRGPSQIVDPDAYAWSDGESRWRGIELEGQVIYELHVGTFTTAGTFAAAARELPELRALGVTLIELMPVAEFPGRFNWGYDGVNLYAPYHGYGDHDALKRFVDAAHREGIAVILDVVYNHLGPDGNYLSCFSEHYFTDRYTTDWGQAINFDGEQSQPVREFFIDNAGYWIAEFHLDGLRLDATQSIFDSGPRHVLAEISQRARAAAQPRRIVLIAENEPQNARSLEPIERGGYGLDAMWNDDFHHSARVALTGRHDGYFHDHRGRAQEFVSAVKYGFLFQGQYYRWQKQARGRPALSFPACSFVAFIQNHDQVANTGYGVRIGALTSPARLRAMTALLLLGPHTPMLFMGQEFGASTPFMFFADHEPTLATAVYSGRREFMRQFRSMATPEAQATIRNPGDEATFRGSTLDFRERRWHATIYALHRELLELRRVDPVLSRPCRERFDGATLGEHALLLRWFDAAHGDRLLIVNLNQTLDDQPAPEPLLAPPAGARWELRWSSEFPRYGGLGATDPWSERGLAVCAESAALLVSVPAAETVSSISRTGARSG